MVGLLLRILFFTVFARLAARVLGMLFGRPRSNDPRPPRPRAPRRRLAGRIVDAEFEDLDQGRR